MIDWKPVTDPPPLHDADPGLSMSDAVLLCNASAARPRYTLGYFRRYPLGEPHTVTVWPHLPSFDPTHWAPLNPPA